MELRDTTKTGYRSRIEALRTGHGHRSVAGLTRERILTGILGPYAGKPGARLAILKMLRVLIHYAIDIGWLKHDPSLGIKRPKTNEIRAWTEAEIATFERRHPTGTKPRLAFALMLYTGQRRSDVHRMTWADVNRSMIRVVQQKTGEKLEIPILQQPEGAVVGSRAQPCNYSQYDVRQALYCGWLQSVDALRHQGRRAALGVPAAWAAQGRRSAPGGSGLQRKGDHECPGASDARGSRALHPRCQPAAPSYLGGDKAGGT